MMLLKPNTPILRYSNTPFRSYASEIFLSSLQGEFFSYPASGLLHLYFDVLRTRNTRRGPSITVT